MKKNSFIQIMILLLLALSTSSAQISRISLDLFPSLNFNLSSDLLPGAGIGAGINLKIGDWLYSGTVQRAGSISLGIYQGDQDDGFFIENYTVFVGKRHERKSVYFDTQIGLGYQHGYIEYSEKNSHYSEKINSPQFSARINFRKSRAIKYLGFGMGLQLNVGLDNVNIVIPFILEIGKMR